MKKLFFSVIAIAITLSSCSSDDETSIVGVYQISSLSQDCIGTVDDFDLTDGDNSISGITLTMSGTMSFNPNGSYNLSLTIEVPLLGTSDTISDSGTYTLEGNSLTTCSNSSTCETNIISPTSNTLTISGSDGSCDLLITGKK